MVTNDHTLQPWTTMTMATTAAAATPLKTSYGGRASKVRSSTLFFVLSTNTQTIEFESTTTTTTPETSDRGLFAPLLLVLAFCERHDTTTGVGPSSLVSFRRNATRGLAPLHPCLSISTQQ